MREILFRGKRIDKGEWAYGYYTKGFHNPGWKQLKDMIYIFSGEPKHYDFDYAVVNPKTVGQYTGLTDRNGKKIFEGDIVKLDDDLMVLEWDEEDAMFILRCLDGTNWITNFSIVAAHLLEIYSNIHEKPELLESK